MNMKHFLRATIATLSLAFAMEAKAQCAGDIAADGKVDGGDLGVLLANWGPVSTTALSRACDLDGNGRIDGADLGMLLANWGNCPTPTWATILEVQPDPSVVIDPVLRAAISATGLPWRVRDTGTQIEMLLVPPGTFQMGCIMGSNQYVCYSWEQPVHQVTLTNAFYLGRYEVTQAQWTARMGSNPSYFQGASYPDAATRPVDWVTWTLVQVYLTASGMRLPTEAEWEYACRAGTQTPFYNGSTDDGTVGALAWYGSCCGVGNSGGQTHAVGGKAANALGFHDMLGNVLEWVNDWSGGYSSSMETNPTGPASGSTRVVRGGSYDGDTYLVRSSIRRDAPPGYANIDFGFRVARNP